MSVTDQSGGKSQEINFTSSCGIPIFFFFQNISHVHRGPNNYTDRAVRDGGWGAWWKGKELKGVGSVLYCKEKTLWSLSHQGHIPTPLFINI